MSHVKPALLIAIDTNVMVAAARSRRGASFALINMIPSQKFQIAISEGLFQEWRSHLLRPENLSPGHTEKEALNFLTYLTSLAHLQDIYFLWRPFLADPKDDMVLELAFASRCRYIISYNVKDFGRAKELGVTAIKPPDFLDLIRDLP